MMNNYIIQYDQMRLILDTSELRGTQNTIVLAISRKNTKSKAISCEVYYGYQEYINKSQASLKPTVFSPKGTEQNIKTQAEACANIQYDVLCTLSLALEIINRASHDSSEQAVDSGLNFEDSLRHSMVNALIGAGILTLAFDFNSSSILNKIAEREGVDSVGSLPANTVNRNTLDSLQTNLSRETGVVVTL